MLLTLSRLGCELQLNIPKLLDNVYNYQLSMDSLLPVDRPIGSVLLLHMIGRFPTKTMKEE